MSTNNFDIYKKALELRSHGVVRTDKLKKDTEIGFIAWSDLVTIIDARYQCFTWHFSVKKIKSLFQKENQ